MPVGRVGRTIAGLRPMHDDTRMTRPAADQWVRGRIVPAALLFVGFGLWRMWGIPLPRASVIALLVAAVIAAIPPLRERAWRLLERVRQPTSAQRFRAALLIGLLATIYLILTGLEQGRDFVPKFHDEHQHLLQMQMLARGRLWMPQHPQADFFESFNIFVKPVYASIYWPGTALMYVPAVWLKLPFWLGPAIASGAIIGLMYRIMTELAD